jgi:hypothetical protein
MAAARVKMYVQRTWVISDIYDRPDTTPHLVDFTPLLIGERGGDMKC